jgi:hypothetical protein
MPVETSGDISVETSGDMPVVSAGWLFINHPQNINGAPLFQNNLFRMSDIQRFLGQGPEIWCQPAISELV